MQERTIGIIGLGVMGSAASAKLRKDRFEAIGYDVLAAPARRAMRAWRHAVPPGRQR
jgi:3-hydroxyisobutyrate dehydrogenase-like beta-hydroxyacid dehydrogenase